MNEIVVMDLAKEVLRLGLQHPEARYHSNGKSCYYDRGKVWEGNKVIGEGCIFGQAMKNLGYEVPDRVMGIKSYLNYKLIKADDNLLDWCNDVQSSQDEGCSWGYSVEGGNRFKIKGLVTDDAVLN